MNYFAYLQIALNVLFAFFLVRLYRDKKQMVAHVFSLGDSVSKLTGLANLQCDKLEAILNVPKPCDPNSTPAYEDDYIQETCFASDNLTMTEELTENITEEERIESLFF